MADTQTGRETNRDDEYQGKGGNMKILSKEKTKVLAEKNGWSLAMAEGYVDGEMSRRRGKAPSTHAQVGIDEYSLGFRAGYYERQARRSPVTPGLSLTTPRLVMQRAHDSGETVEVSAAKAQGG
jgi:hypothetical protein